MTTMFSYDFDPRPFSDLIIRNHKLVVDKYNRFWIYDEKTDLWKENPLCTIN